ncbi:MAG: hypothetical protein AMXMBFR36_23140 [Acidobacteriota bacterium]
MPSIRAFAVALVLAVAFASAVPAATVAGVELPATVRVGDTTLALNGAGLRSKLMFKVYVGALYLVERNGDAARVLAADQTRRMELRFLRDVSKTQLCDSWDEGLAANVPGAGSELTAAFGELCAAMADVGEGAILSLTYRPGAGTEVAIDGTAKRTIAGKPFADAVLACWIGPEPGPGEDFKDAVLGR